MTALSGHYWRRLARELLGGTPLERLDTLAYTAAYDGMIVEL